METENFYINNEEYTLVDVYNEGNGKIVQLDSDEDTILLFIDEDYTGRFLTPEEDKKYREKYHLIDYGIVTFTVKDLINFNPTAKKVDKAKEEQYKQFLMKKLEGIDTALAESPYIKRRLDAIRLRFEGKLNYYSRDTVYVIGTPKRMTDWRLAHETVHGIVDKSRLNSFGLIEGITDYMTGKLLPQGNYSQNHQLYGGKIQVNHSCLGQNHLVTLARQLEYGLGEDYNLHEMFIHPHDQIKQFGKKYGRSETRILLHKINNLYYNATVENYKIAQQYMLEVIFNKKFEQVVDVESAKNYFEELINFGLLRGRFDGKDDALKEYYERQKQALASKGIDMSVVPNYTEKKFYPCGDRYLNYEHYIAESIKARKEGKGTNFQIMYNRDNTCVYIIVDGKLRLIQDDSVERKRKFIEAQLDHENYTMEQLENGNYLIKGPDGIVEEVRETDAGKRIDAYFEKREAQVVGKGR